jgi:carboxylesterase type B
MDATGKITMMGPADCAKELPILCTQSAPLSNTTFANNTMSWQVTQAVGENTLMTGYRDAHTWKFRGIRYAKTPKRFGYSTEPFLEGGEVSAISPGADCVQPIGEVKNGSSEDCLFMNIWTPHLPRMAGVKKEELRPVMLYLYGGGFTSGSGKNPNTDGTNLASRGDVVSVSINYRVGNIGFLAFDDGVHNGNYALSDMVTALEWVKLYISYFGGDPDRVTLFGESAGAQATHILLGSPKAAGLFHRAIMQSDPQGYPRNGKFSWMTYDTIEDAYNGGTQRVLNLTGCLDADNQILCLEKFSGFDLVNLTTNIK